LIKTAHLHKKDILYNYYQMNRDSIREGSKGKPYAFVIPKKQNDYPTTLRMLKILKFGGVHIHQAGKDFMAGEKPYPAGSFIVYMAQPYRPYAQALLEKQKYPNMRQYPGGPPIPPYDNAGWTLPLQMGVRCDRIEKPFKAETEKLSTIPSPSYSPPEEKAAYFLLDSRINASYTAVFSLMNETTEIFRSKEPVTGEGYCAAAGSFIIKYDSGVKNALPKLMASLHIQPLEVKDFTTIPKARINKQKIGLYQSWRSNMDEGWTRYVLDDLGIPYVTLHNKDFKAKKLNLKEKFGIIIFASENPDIIKLGKPSPTSPYARYYSGNMPKEYEGGIGKEGVAALKSFVEQGGILVTLNDACGLIFKEFKSPVRNAMERVDRSKFFCPTSILRVNVKTTSPIGYGFSDEAAVMFSRSLGMSTRVPSGDWDRTVVASYPKDNVLLSGWLLGEDMITRKAAVVDAKYKKGHIILIGIRCQHRAQSHGSYKFLLNALLYPEI